MRPKVMCFLLAALAVAVVSDPAVALANSGFVEKVPAGRQTMVAAEGGDVFIVRPGARVSEVELRVISALKAYIAATWGASARNTPYVIDLERREAQVLDPNTRAYVKLPFSQFL